VTYAYAPAVVEPSIGSGLEKILGWTNEDRSPRVVKVSDLPLDEQRLVKDLLKLSPFGDTLQRVVNNADLRFTVTPSARLTVQVNGREHRLSLADQRTPAAIKESITPGWVVEDAPPKEGFEEEPQPLVTEFFGPKLPLALRRQLIDVALGHVVELQEERKKAVLDQLGSRLSARFGPGVNKKGDDGLASLPDSLQKLALDDFEASWKINGYSSPEAARAALGNCRVVGLTWSVQMAIAGRNADGTFSRKIFDMRTVR